MRSNAQRGRVFGGRAAVASNPDTMPGRVYVAVHLTDPSRVYKFDTPEQAQLFASTENRYIVSTRDGAVVYDDFPRRNIYTRPIEIAPIPLHLLRDRI